MTGYAIIEAWTRAVERAGTFDAKAVALELEKFDKEPLLAGDTTYTPEWHINFRHAVDDHPGAERREKWDRALRGEQVPPSTSRG